MKVTNSCRIKSLLKLSEYREEDISISLLCGWSNFSLSKNGEWEGLSPDGQIKVVPFFCEHEAEAKLLADIIMSENPGLELCESVEDNDFICYWRLKQRKSYVVCRNKNSRHSAALALSCLEVLTYIHSL